MLVCFGLFGLLLYNTVVANDYSQQTAPTQICWSIMRWQIWVCSVCIWYLLITVCSFTYSQKDQIKALSLLYQQKGYRKCEYNIKAPRNSYIELNLTNLIGFWSHPSMPPGKLQTSSYVDPNVCLLPELIIEEATTTTTTTVVEQYDSGVVKICKNSNSYQSPKVFHSKLNSLKLTFRWVQDQSSGFTLEFDFHQHRNNCLHHCDVNSNCLSDGQILCNPVQDCNDSSVKNCKPWSQTTGAASQSSNVDFIKIIVIIISVVLMPGLFIIICVVSPCRLRSHMWRRRRSRDRAEHSQLRPHSQPDSSEVVYVPTNTSHDYLIEQQRNRQVQLHSVQTDTMLDLPPQIPVSKDGEEGYIESQKHLLQKRKDYQDYQDMRCFRAPPNRTVFDRESPPPYSSNSANLETVDRPPPARIVRDSNGCPVMHRCYSMSSNNNNNNAPLHHHYHPQQHPFAQTHTRTLSTNSTGRARTLSSSSARINLVSTDEPPDYSTVFSCDTSANSPASSDKSVS